MTDESADQPAEIEGRLFWPLDDPRMQATPMVNQTVTQIQRGNSGRPHYVIWQSGHSNVPMFAGDVDQQVATATTIAQENHGVLPVRIEPVARMAMTIEHLRDIARIASDTITKWDRMVEEAESND